MRKQVTLAGGGCTAHLYLDQRRQGGEGESLLRSLLEGDAPARSEGFTDKGRLEAYLAGQMPSFIPYFKIRKQGTTYVLHRCVETIDAALSGMGIFVLITNSELSSERVLDYYRERNGVEKCFDGLKNNLFLKRLRVYSDTGQCLGPPSAPQSSLRASFRPDRFVLPTPRLSESPLPGIITSL
jgi:hypothetical protein